jgi:hypothetical protein
LSGVQERHVAVKNEENTSIQAIAESLALVPQLLGNPREVGFHLAEEVDVGGGPFDRVGRLRFSQTLLK